MATLTAALPAIRKAWEEDDRFPRDAKGFMVYPEFTQRLAAEINADLRRKSDCICECESCTAWIGDGIAQMIVDRALSAPDTGEAP